MKVKELMVESCKESSRRLGFMDRLAAATWSMDRETRADYITWLIVGPVKYRHSRAELFAPRTDTSLCWTTMWQFWQILWCMLWTQNLSS